MESDNDDEIAPEHEKAFEPFSQLVDLLAQMAPADLARLNRREEERLRQTPASAKRTRKPTLVSVAKQAASAGLEVARYEVDPDGKITVVTGKPDGGNKPANELDAWIARRNAH